jgi:hypothetical protein
MAVGSLVNFSRLIIPGQHCRRRDDRNSKHGVVQLNRQQRDSGGRVAKRQRNGGWAEEKLAQDMGAKRAVVTHLYLCNVAVHSTHTTLATTLG